MTPGTPLWKALQTVIACGGTPEGREALAGLVALALKVHGDLDGPDEGEASLPVYRRAFGELAGSVARIKAEDHRAGRLIVADKHADAVEAGPEDQPQPAPPEPAPPSIEIPRERIPDLAPSTRREAPSDQMGLPW